jgi:D-amino-acid dehydrogenase
MHIVVIGAGIVGMMSAYFLRESGHCVSVIEAGSCPGQVTSRANGAQLSYSFVAPLADPAVLPKLPAWLTDRDGPLRLKLRADPALWRWG